MIRDRRIRGYYQSDSFAAHRPDDAADICFGYNLGEATVDISIGPFWNPEGSCISVDWLSYIVNCIYLPISTENPLFIVGQVARVLQIFYDIVKRLDGRIL
jgi:hypothetical protein